MSDEDLKFFVDGQRRLGANNVIAHLRWVEERPDLNNTDLIGETEDMPNRE